MIGIFEYLRGVDISSLSYHYRDIVRETTGADPKKSPSLTTMANEIREWITDPDKPWLWIGGGAGTGKSTMLEALSRAINANPGYICLKISARDMFNRKYDSLERHEALADKTQTEICDTYAVILLDDVGIEKQIGNDYGNVNAPFVDYVDLRYSRGRGDHPRFTTCIFTSNLSPEDILDRYGMRTLERIKEMCRTVNGGNQSFR